MAPAEIYGSGGVIVTVENGEVLDTAKEKHVRIPFPRPGMASISTGITSITIEGTPLGFLVYDSQYINKEPAVYPSGRMLQLQDGLIAIARTITETISDK